MAIDKILKIEGSSITWTCKQIVKMIEKDTISFKNIVQRSFVWERHRMSELIWSIIMGYPIPPIYAERGDSDNDKVKIYDVMDGQQRNVSIYKYMKDEFALTELKPIPYLDENGNERTIDISGKKFSELEEELQDIIKDATITVKYYDNLDQSQKAEMFRRLNNGKPLSTKSRTLASAKNIGGLLDIGSHKLFEEMLTEKARANKNHAVIVVKMWAMMTKDVKDVSFSSKDFNPMIEEAEISAEEKQKLVNLFDFIVDVHNELVDNKEKSVAKKLYTETHLVSLVPYINSAIENDISESMVAEWLINFFKTENDTDVYAKYNEACMNGIARNASIVARHEALGESYKEFFKVEENSEKVS
jgi:uncharacterized protein with ParB-like and HNH nuclease domain